jgi:hypothetical protein
LLRASTREHGFGPVSGWRPPLPVGRKPIERLCSIQFQRVSFSLHFNAQQS